MITAGMLVTVVGIIIFLKCICIARLIHVVLSAVHSLIWSAIAAVILLMLQLGIFQYVCTIIARVLSINY